MKKVFLSALTTAAAAAFLSVGTAYAAGNTTIDSFNEAKKTLERKVYMDHRVTFYCRAVFDSRKNITLPDGFTTPKHEKRARRIVRAMPSAWITVAGTLRAASARKR